MTWKQKCVSPRGPLAPKLCSKVEKQPDGADVERERHVSPTCVSQLRIIMRLQEAGPAPQVCIWLSQGGWEQRRGSKHSLFFLRISNTLTPWNLHFIYVVLPLHLNSFSFICGLHYFLIHVYVVTFPREVKGKSYTWYKHKVLYSHLP